MLSQCHGAPSSRLITSRSRLPQFYVCQRPQHSSRRCYRSSVLLSHSRCRRRQLNPSPRSYSSKSPHVQSREFSSSIRRYAANKEEDRGIAILGGGITGLSAAYYASKFLPDRHVTLFEQTDRLGGWMKTQSVEVPGGQILFDTGPKSLRPQPPNGLLTRQMVYDLNLQDDVLPVSIFSPAAQNRFVYYPDHLVHMPVLPQSLSEIFSNLYRLWFEPVFNKFFYSLFREHQKPRRPSKVTDETVAKFVSRRMHPALAENLVSAVFHGIYAGDTHRLSARSILTPLWMFEHKNGSISKSVEMRLLEKSRWQFCDDLELQLQTHKNQADNGNVKSTPANKDLFKQVSVYTFRHGLAQLANRLEEFLSQKSNVTIFKSTKITGISKVTDEDKAALQISYNVGNEASVKTTGYDHVISTIPPSALLPLIEKTLTASSSNRASEYRILQDTIGKIPTVTVCVVNLYFTTPDLLQKVSPPGGLPSSLGKGGLQGFGYLIPSSVPTEQNPEFALGVQFDSDINPDLYTTVPPEKRGTKLTVMLGGHWWDGWSTLPSNAEAEEMAKSTLRRHLGITEQPAYICATMQRNCIPQYVLGHATRLAEAHEALWHSFHGALRLAGSWYSGVGVNDCVRAGHDVIQGLAYESGSSKNPKASVRRTGLEKFTSDGRPMVLVEEKGGKMSVKEADESATRLGFWYSLDQHYGNSKDEGQ